MKHLKELVELTKGLNTLYVEDDLLIKKTMTQYLKKFFDEVVVANNGLEGLEAYKTQKFDIVITDLSMPKMNGLDMLKQIKGLNDEQIVLITTAHSESDYMFGAIKAGIDGYIIKPFDFTQLNQEIFKIAQKLKKFKENEEYKLHLQQMVDEKTLQLKDNYEKTLFSMVEMIEKRDTYTAGHSKRVAEYCVKIATEMGYSEEECTVLHQAGILHDVGKIGTPDTILLKPSKLNEIEYKLIQEHVTVGYKLLHNIPMFEPLAEIIYSHHERYDGKGYPEGLKGDKIIPFARIMIVADAFDAMTTNRIYKSKKTVKEALAELKELSAKQFHPEVIEKALIALNDVEVDKNISQLPKTELEQERFAYFYKDTLSEVYNQNYLDVVLAKNNHNVGYRYMEVFLINGFSNYNKKYGWENGNMLLKEFANTLHQNLQGNLIFRVFGDDFVVISKEKLNLLDVKTVLDKIKNITYITKNIDLSVVNISKSAQIENL